MIFAPEAALRCVSTSSCYFSPQPKKSNKLGISAFCFINFRIILVSLCVRECVYFPCQRDKTSQFALTISFDTSFDEEAAN